MIIIKKDSGVKEKKMCFSSDESNRLHEDDVTWTTSSFTTGSSSKNIYIVLHILSLPLKYSFFKRLLYISAILYGWPCSRRPVGTRRRQLEWLTNFVLVVVSLMGCSVGAGLIGFYQLHLLSFISYEFFIIPLVLLGKAYCYSLLAPRVPGN